MLQARQLAVQRGSRMILQGVDLRLEPGTVTAVVGPNGSGKSTLMKVLTGELPAAQGEIQLRGHPLAEWMRQPRAIARWRAVLPQQSNLFFNFPVLDVVLMGRSPHLEGGETRRDLAICEEALGQVDCLHLRDRMFQHLSGGERQRIQLARVLAQLHDAVEGDGQALLFLDEPTSNVDLKHQLSILALTRTFAARGATVCVVLHDLQQARAYADQCLMLHDGSIHAAGPPREALTPANIEAVFDVPVTWQHCDGHDFLHLQPNQPRAQ